MADPLSIIAIMALVYAGRTMASSSEPEILQEKYQEQEPEQTMPDGMFESMSRITHQYMQPGISDVQIQHKKEMPSFAEVAFMKHVNGEPFHDFSNREYVSGKMNNLAPTPMINVGRGLGLDPSVPAAGGYQQLYRVNPTNVGAYRLTTLPGRIAPMQDITGGRAPVVGELTHFPPSKTAFLPSRYPVVPGRAQGQGGALTGGAPRQEEEKTKRTTHRSETSYRGDGLQFAPAKSTVSALAKAQAPTRNKGDQNDEEYKFTNRPAPGIHSFVGGFDETPEAKLLAGQRPAGGYSNKELEAFGMRCTDDRRAKNDRPGNAGRMNVRESALKQGGMLTAVRSDASDGYTGNKNGSSYQNYKIPTFQDNNAYKGTQNILTLDIAKNQLRNNIFAKPLAI